MPPTAITRSIFYRGSEQRPFLLPPRFHGAPGVEAAPRRTGQNSCADNELAGAPEEIRTPDPQIRSLVLYPAELRARLAHRAGNVPKTSKAAGNAPLAIGFGQQWQVRHAQKMPGDSTACAPSLLDVGYALTWRKCPGCGAAHWRCTADPGPPRSGTIPGLQRTTSCCAAPGTHI